jgi:hypothetical protein
MFLLSANDKQVILNNFWEMKFFSQYVDFAKMFNKK